MELAASRDFSFRLATPDDAVCIGVLGIQVFLDTYALDGIRPSLAREVLQALSPDVVAEIIARPGNRIIVAETLGHMAGFAQMAERSSHPLVPDADASELNRLYVQRPFTGRGLGSRLLAQAELAAAGAGASALWLTAWIGNARALAFYPRRGYRQLGSTLYTFEGEQHENRLFVKGLDR